MGRTAVRLLTLCMIVAGQWALPAQADADRRHAVSLMDEPRFPADFQHFDWVNPDAPKGGTLVGAAVGSFDSLNPYTIKGDAAVGVQALVFDSLMVTSLDEPSTEYGLVAEWVAYPDDYSSATFKLREGATFQDGKPITVEDVIFSLEAMKKASPLFALYYKNVNKGEKTGEREVTFSFDMSGNRELPLILGQLPVLPKHFWEAKGQNGEPRDITKTTLEPLLGSGPYRIADVKPGRELTFERVKDYWAKDLPVMRGQYNFDTIRYIYFKDRTPAFEAFLSGQIDYWFESSANAWATRYNTDALKAGQIEKEKLPHGRVAPMQAFVYNTRRAKFADARVRRALNLAFDFESVNQSLFYGMYERVSSFFDNSELAAKGLPKGRELEVLSEYKDQLPPELFTEEWSNPKNVSPRDFRDNLRKAMELLNSAGWRIDGGKLVDAQGEQMKIEFLTISPDMERVIGAYAKSLRRLGIDVSIRTVDSSQYTRRLETFDFDAIVDSYSQSHSPGNEQREYWGSAAADKPGSRNRVGIKNPVIDALIERLVQAQSREDVVELTRAIDRVLLWNHYVVPQWHFPYDRVAYWAMFGRPEKLPRQSPASIAQTWWLDKDKAEALTAKRGM